MTIYGVPSPFERHDGATSIGRHRHHTAYLTLLLSGSYDEDGDQGRVRMKPGNALFHRPFEAHRNEIARRGAHMISFALPSAFVAPSLCVVDDPDFIARVAESDSTAALRLACQMARPAPRRDPHDWPDMLAAAIRSDSTISVGGWARKHGLARETACRGFRKAFGIPPDQYRWEARTRAAVDRIANSSEPMSRISADLRFADQAHMCRLVKAMTNHSPGHWRSWSQSFKTSGPEPS